LQGFEDHGKVEYDFVAFCVSKILSKYILQVFMLVDQLSSIASLLRTRSIVQVTPPSTLLIYQDDQGNPADGGEDTQQRTASPPQEREPRK
jgi:hypothetical protein